MNDGFAKFISKESLSALRQRGTMPNWLNNIGELNPFDADNGEFFYPFFLFSAGHGIWDEAKSRKTFRALYDRPSFARIVADSGAFQIATNSGVFKDFDWSERGDKTRDMIRRNLEWQEGIADWATILDIPLYALDPGKKNPGHPYFGTGYTTQNIDKCFQQQMFNVDEQFKRKQPSTKLIVILQGTDEETVLKYYGAMKDYPHAGWGFGGGMSKRIDLLLYILAQMIDDGQLAKGEKILHFFKVGTGHHAVLFSHIQKLLRHHVNPNITITFDASNAFSGMTNWTMFTGHEQLHDENLFRMVSVNAGKGMPPYNARVPAESPIMGYGKEGVCWDDLRPGDYLAQCMVMAQNIWAMTEAMKDANLRADRAGAIHQARFREHLLSALDEAEGVYRHTVKDDVRNLGRLIKLAEGIQDSEHLVGLKRKDYLDHVAKAAQLFSTCIALGPRNRSRELARYSANELEVIFYPFRE